MAVTLVKKQKHFLESRMIQHEQPSVPVGLVKIEAVFSKTTKVIA